MSPFTLVPIHFLREYVSLARSTPPGCMVEVGVYQGGSAYHFATVALQQHRELFLYDTFTGIPCKNESKGDAHDIGDFSDTTAEAVRRAVPSATVIEGLFPESMVDMPPVAFAHIDVDQYRSVKDCILALWPKMVDGGIMIFDDYGALEGATQAVREHFDLDQIKTMECGRAYVVKGE